MKYLFALFTCLTVTACTTENVLPKDHLLGTWLVAGYYFDPGNGSGSFQQATKEEKISFKSDGSFSKGWWIMDIPYSKYYATDTSIFFIEAKDTAVYDYKIINGQLTLDGHCSESCVITFKKSVPF